MMKAIAAKAITRAFDGLAPVLNIAVSRRARSEDLAPVRSRRAFLAAVHAKRSLEIGPFCNPILHGPGVRYFDVLDSDALVERGRALGLDIGAVPHIDFVSPTGDLSVVEETFDVVAGSHSIEHQPDLVRHLQKVERLLTTRGGYYVIVPDKRYSFDHFISASTLSDVLDAYHEQRVVHTPEAVRAHRLDTTHNVPIAHWLGVHGGKRRTAARLATAEQEIRQAERGEYVDVHAWTFTPRSFLAITDALHERGMTRLKPEVVHATGFGQLEFFAVLRKVEA